MRSRWTRFLIALPALTLPGGLLAAPPPSPGTLLAKGFRAHTMSCFEIPSTGAYGSQVIHAACSPGGSWGPYVFVSLRDVYDPFAYGQLATIDGRGKIDYRGTGRHPGYFDFSSPGGPWGDRLWLDTDDPFAAPGVMGGCSSDFMSCDSTCADTDLFAFDPSGNLDFALYVPDGQGISRLTDPHDCSLQPGGVIEVPNLTHFSDASALPLTSGPGGAWGGDLYASPGTIVHGDGTWSTFPFPFARVTWSDPSSGAWAGDMFARMSGGDSGAIYRVGPNGSATLFATDLPGEIAFCADGLWIVRNGACTKITATGAAK